MAVDEFGREIPQPQTGPSSSYNRSSSRTRSTSAHHQHHHHAPSSSSHGGPRRPPSPQQRGSHHHHHHGQRRRSSETGHSHSSSRGSSSHKATPHPSKRYQSDPLLCEFVWKDQQKKKNNKKKEDGGEEDSQEEGTATTSQQQQQDENDKEAMMKEEEDDNDDTNNNNTSSSSNYSDYKRDYCLQYVRAFFNQHLDDSWFRQQYSPLEQRSLVLQNRARAADEARSIRTSLQQNDNNKTMFVKQARLWKDNNSKNDQDTTNVQSHLFSWNDRLLHVADLLPEITNEQLQQALMDFVDETTIVESSNNSKKESQQQQPLLQVFNATPDRNTLVREAIVVCRSAAVQQQLLSALQARQQRRHHQHQHSSSSPRKGVPRKDEDDSVINKWLQLDVDYSDPYNRLEYDANGKGGPPADGLAVPTRKCVVRVRGLSSNKNSSSSSSSSLASNNNKVVTLSAALSHPSRIARDKKAAILIARALDVSQHIPTECRLDEILESLGFGEQQQEKKLSSAAAAAAHNADAANSSTKAGIEEEEEANVLDVAIAYLRRVHLFSFYNCCTLSDNVANVMIGKHAASTIHVRLPNAEDILQTTATTTTTTTASGTENQQEGAITETKDLLVQRLDDSIAKALEDCNAWINSGGDGTVIDEQTDQDADAIEQAVASAHEQWLQDHSIDDGGRARCSFHFCHKLFKDASFLHKHLLKKHGEFLKAEQAKCHDEYMMKAWDAEEKRPVPDILVDCGANFGLVATSISGREPDCIDPEPELWRKEEERRQREAEQRQRREEMRQQQRQQSEMAADHHAAADNNNNNMNHAPRAPATSFVDVDDMKEEKVELSFENVEIPAPTKKKKKKKRKLL